MMNLISYFTLFLFYITPCFCVKTEQGRYYDRVEWHDFETLEDFRHSLMALNTDGEYVTTTHIYLGVYHPECQDKFNIPSFRGSQKYTGGFITVSATLPASEFPYPTPACATLYCYSPNHTIEFVTAMHTEIDDRSVTNLLNDERIASFNVTNSFPYEVILVYHPSTGPPIVESNIETNDHIQMTAWLGHIFSVRRKIPTNEHGNYTFDSELSLIQGDIPGYSEPVDFFVTNRMNQNLGPHNRLDTCDNYPEEMIFVPNFDSCGNMTFRFDQFRTYMLFTKRQGMNYVQPRVVRRLTREGFVIRQLSETQLNALYKSMDEGMENIRPEGMTDECKNDKYAPSYLIRPSREVEIELHMTIKPMIREWFGMENGNIQVSSIYGVRRYTRGSVLRMHADNPSSHALSAIINVDQKVEEDWPLIILDHDGVEHTVIMKPGDILLYESAKLLHGRPEPLRGDHYDNIFVHYRPNDWDYEWFIPLNH